MTDTEFLLELRRCAFRYFAECAHPETGLVPDRAAADGSAPGSVASVAATGFGLTALAIGDANGWMGGREARARAERTLLTLLEDAPRTNGFLYHFLDTRSAARAWECEVSSIDTALAIFGALAAGARFGGTVMELARTLEAEVEWEWMLDDRLLIRHGWRPETGFLEWSWDRFSEHWGMTCLAMCSPEHPIPSAAWTAWTREPWVDFGGERFLHHPPLFVHQFPQAWLDWRNYTDPSGVNFFRNAAAATRAQRRFCMDLRGRFPSYSSKFWGLTSSDSEKGYVDWGCPPVPPGAVDPRIDGTVVPCAAAGSLPFEPGLCTEALREMYRVFGYKAWGPYGFADAFNLCTGWVARDVIGIDQGISLVMAENLASGLVWDLVRPFVPLPPSREP